MKPTKFFFAVFIVVALSLAALFFRSKQQNEQSAVLKPSQLDFSRANEIQDAPPELPVAAPPEEPAVAANPQIAVFEEILKSNNDNDPRLDTVLKKLSPETKSALFERYEKIKPEDRDGRGLVVFLIARDISSDADVEFLQKVFQEQPCFSLGDCKNTGSDEPHFSGVNETTLNYPQFAGLFQLESQLAMRPELLQNPRFKMQLESLLKQAENFPVPAISDKAAEMKKRFGL